MMITVDRVEGDFAVCELEDGTFKDIAISELPDGIKQGTVLEFLNGEYKINLEAQRERAAEILALQDSIFDE